jgi:hypothetical protein
MPQGLVAELLASARRTDDFARLVAANAEARAHILRLPDYLFGADLEERELVDEYVDLARRLHAREIARAAAIDASKR